MWENAYSTLNISKNIYSWIVLMEEHKVNINIYSY